ncbi:hypothetical protein OGAPHI_000052 [Ogataea philodendri]|uniref:Protein kinase domain-containing protein n=1 Tax=Ogataea philodendri TaxID=1378263 RepID=A0A9P8TAG9_9ASCO|nr:uncharacterized protein OGAPHI_000052 [Ogataea philodendri]KAH3671866.1 hypothetical protein OGAPHI_000052 [Ogataea philodendri]
MGNYQYVSRLWLDGNSKTYWKGNLWQGECADSVSTNSSILCKLDHPNIIKVYGLHENYKETYFYQDLAIGGDLFSYLCNGTDTLHPIREPGALFIVFQVAMALEYIHSMGITHRDLKLDNVLIKDVPSRYPHIVLADFGAAQESSFPKLSRPADRMYTMIGTAEYAAPEIKLGLDRSQKGYTNKVDIWSLGIIAHILLSGISPFHDETTEKVFQKVQKAHIDLEIKQWRHISVEAKLFVKGCLRPRVSQRFDIHDCMRSQWINQKGRRKLLDNCYSAVVTNK